MNRRPPVTLVAPRPPAAAVPGLAALAFGSASVVLGEGKHLAFLPLESLELDLSDPEQRDFGDYELIEQLGQGGMGVVYRARQRSLDREVGLKLLSAGPWASAEFISRFTREAQSAARLQHPNIVPIYEIGSHAELNFFSMALVRGGSLAQRLDQSGPLPAADAAALVRIVAEAVDYAHRLGILHLDLKPANVLLDEHGEPQVADFGLAKRLDETLANDSEDVSGTPSYMAPEQAQVKSHRLSKATDIYGLGAILYELLTGRPPFLGATARDTLQQVVDREPIRPREYDSRLSEDLEAICLKCLAKDPRQRYITARGLAEDLGRFLEGRAVSVRPLNGAQRLQRWARREPKVAVAAAFALAALLTGLVATSLQWRRAESQSQRAEANAASAREHLWTARTQAGETKLAAGDAFAALRPLVQNLSEMEAAGRMGDAAVERQRIGTALANAPRLVDLIQLGDSQSIAALAISPDGHHFAVATHGGHEGRWVRQFEIATRRELWATSTAGLPHAMPARGLPHAHLRYTPDGRHLLVGLLQLAPFAAPTKTDALALDARDGRVLMPPDTGDPHADIVYSEDARLALVRYRSAGWLRFPDSGQFYDTATWRALGPRRVLDASVASDFWLPMPDGRAWLGSSDFNRFTLFDPATMQALWRLQLPQDELARAWRFNADASLLALGTTTGAVYLVDTRDGSRSALPSSPTTTVRWLEFAADATTLAAWGEDGSIMLWDLANRRPRAAPMPGLGGWHPGLLRLAGDEIYSAGNNLLRYWSLAPRAPFDNLAVPGAARLRSSKAFHRDAFDVHPGSRLLLTGDQNGRINYWRLPPAVVQQARAAPLPPRAQGFDGKHVVGVAGAVTQLRDAATGAPRSPEFRHPEPVRFAELSFDGRHLVTIAGRTVRVFDPATGAVRGEPLVLEQTPLRVDTARAASVLALTTGEYRGDVLHERIMVIDLDTGRPRATSPAVVGPLQAFDLDPLGRYVLVQGWTRDAEPIRVERIELTAAAPPCPAPVADIHGIVFSTAIADDGRSAWIASDAPKRRLLLRRLDLETCRELVRHEFPQGGANPILLAHGEEVVMNRLTVDALGRFGADGKVGAVARLLPERAHGEFALSRDGRRVAVATRNSVLLIEREHGERLSAPLVAPIAGNDGIAKLAFSPDATRLLARTIKGRWLLWHLPAATQSAADLAVLATVLDPEAADATLDATATESLRQRLRDVDPGGTPDSPARRTPVTEFAAAPGAQTDPRYLPLDLGPALNVPLNGAWPAMPLMRGDLPTLAPGPQRLLGIDWRIDGGVQLSGGGAAVSLHPMQLRSESVSLPGVRARRVHVLVVMRIPMSPNQPPHDMAKLVLSGEDGRETALAIRTRRDVVTDTSPQHAEASARIGWIGIGSGAVRDGNYTSSQTVSAVYAVSLEVPPELGALRALRFQVGEGPMEAPLFYAVTLEVDAP